MYLHNMGLSESRHVNSSRAVSVGRLSFCFQKVRKAGVSWRPQPGRFQVPEVRVAAVQWCVFQFKPQSHFKVFLTRPH